MAINNFIPTIWSARLLANLNKAHVYAQPGIINRDYEGEISQAGDTVKINSIGRVTVATYTKNTDINDPEVLDDASQILRIDQQKYFNFQVDDVDAAQQNPKVMDEAMEEAAYGLRDVADSYVAGLFTDIDANNFIGSDASPKTVNATAGNTPYEYLVQLGVKLDDANVPMEGRFVVLPNWMYGLILLDDRFVKAGTPTSDTVLRNGLVGEAAGFSIYKSNNVPNTNATKYKVIAGIPRAWTYADQVMKTEAFRMEKRFSDAVKGLHVYGAKVTRPSALACLVASP